LLANVVSRGSDRLNLDVLFRVPSIAGFDIKKDGTRLALNSNRTGQYEIYLYNLKTQESKQITFAPEAKTAPRFSPTHQELAYSHDYQGNEQFDILLMDLETEESRNITPDTKESISPFVDWSPDGQRMAISSNKSGKFSIYTLNRTGGEPSLVHDHQYIDYDPEWSPDGKKIAFTSLVKGQDQGIFMTNLSDHETTQLANYGHAVESSSPDWSPDGHKVAFESADKGSYDIGVYDESDQKVEWVTDGKMERDSPTWSHDGSMLSYLENQNSNLVIRLYRYDTGETDTIQLMPGIHSHVRFSPDNKTIYFLYSGPRNPTDLWSHNLDSGQFRQLTKSLPVSLDTSSFVSPTNVSYKSVDGKTIPALLYKPGSERGKGKPPAIVYVHGGPTAQFMNSWNPLVQEYLDQGFIVIAPNYRGSTGYGREFREANRFVMGQLDLADVVKGAEYLSKNSLADPARIGITGGSFGGYLTMCALARYPSLWAAGSAIVPFLNWFTEIQNERDDLRYWDMQNMGDPEKDKDRLREASPIFFIDQIRVPVQMIAGAHDPRCPPSETLQAQNELRKHGKQADVVIYPDEGHGFLKMDNRVDAYKKNVHFLTDRVKKIS